MTLGFSIAHLLFKSFVLCAWFSAHGESKCYSPINVTNAVVLICRWLAVKRTKNTDRGQRAGWESSLFLTCNFLKGEHLQTLRSMHGRTVIEVLFQAKRKTQRDSQATEWKTYLDKILFEEIVLGIQVFSQNCHLKGFSDFVYVVYKNKNVASFNYISLVILHFIKRFYFPLYEILHFSFLKVFRYSFSEAIPIFFNRFKSDFILVWSL